jgi:predicted DNA-binding protein (UPF0278 family)
MIKEFSLVPDFSLANVGNDEETRKIMREEGITAACERYAQKHYSREYQAEEYLSSFIEKFEDKYKEAFRCGALEDDEKPINVATMVGIIVAESYDRSSLDKAYKKNLENLNHFI